eukprot:CAMPEP_0179071022 /NCGR_PEP_ID=MMETSP0796-20121207/31319_1 /TAXON_ID=73915 /ORGANISM="Pyrodinium bahamense, Strain pbaha01" /LENGTH=257 /DNA_ID=CAMNT_0020768127 /DNA_START=41 /DNA_END=814 /DNA_ORIENTATION=-
MRSPLAAVAPGRRRWRVRRARNTAALAVLAAVAAASSAALWLHAKSVGWVVPGASAALESLSVTRHGARSVARAAVGSVEGDEFKAARDRIRRIQLGLGPDDPLPEDGEEPEAKEESVVPTAKGELDLAESGVVAEQVVANVTSDMSTTDATDAEKDAESLEPVADAYAGTMKDVEELKPEIDSKKDGPNFIQGLITDIGLVTLPSPGEVAQTFGIVLALVAAYTSFIAVVDYGSQLALGQVFEEFYKAARPEAPSL